MTVKCKVYNKIYTFKTMKEAEHFFLEAMNCSEGSEQERYITIYLQLMRGHQYCVDQELPDTVLNNMEKILMGD